MSTPRVNQKNSKFSFASRVLILASSLLLVVMLAGCSEISSAEEILERLNQAEEELNTLIETESTSDNASDSTEDSTEDSSSADDTSDSSSSDSESSDSEAGTSSTDSSTSSGTTGSSSSGSSSSSNSGSSSSSNSGSSGSSSSGSSSSSNSGSSSSSSATTASYSELSASLSDLTTRVEAAIATSEAVSVPTDVSSRLQAYRTAKAPLEALEDELDRLEDAVEYAARAGSITYAQMQELERSIDNLDDRLERAEDALERRMGVDD